jgi:hypothetical protein
MILLRSKICGIRWISLLSSIRYINELSLSMHNVCVIVISYRTEHASFFDPCMLCTQLYPKLNAHQLFEQFSTVRCI